MMPGTRLILVAALAGLLSVQARAEVSAGGFLKVHALYGDINAAQNLRGDQELFIPHLSVQARPAADAHRSHVHARASRLWLRASNLNTLLGAMELYAEGDLFKEYQRYRPRLRHAYVNIGRLQVGQSWSTFVNTAALADIDAGTSVGNSVTRQHLLRWTQPLTEALDLQFALESPLNRLHFDGQTGITSSERDSSRDLAIRLNGQPRWGSLSLAAVRRELSARPAHAARVIQRNVTAFSLAGRFNSAGLDNLRFMFNHGEGLARHATLGTFPDAVVESGETLEPVTVSSALLAWQHFWTPRLRSTLAWSLSRAALPASAATTLTRKASSAHLNLIWAPTQRYSMGIEYLHAGRELQDGRDGELQRWQLTWRLNF